jgi:uncharacterized membrane protein (DUF2068 family)
MAIVGLLKVIRLLSPFGGLAEYENVMGYSRMVTILRVVLNICMTILYFSVGRGLWLGRYWARIAAIILCIIVIANNIYILVAMPFLSFWANMSAIVNILVILYLLLSKNAINYLQRKQIAQSGVLGEHDINRT